MNIQYKTKRIQGQELRASNTKSKPAVSLLNTQRFLTLAMWDPDAPGAHPSWLHWLIVNIPHGDIEQGTTLVPYTPPTPPQGTGLHRYFFTLYEQERRIPMTAAPTKRSGFHAANWAGINRLRLREHTFFVQRS